MADFVFCIAIFVSVMLVYAGYRCMKEGSAKFAGIIAITGIFAIISGIIGAIVSIWFIFHW